MKRIGLILGLFTLAVFAQQPARPDTHPPGGMVTVTVARFSELEKKIAAAVQEKDEEALKALSVEDFELRMASQPDLPMPRDEWLANLLPVYELRDFRFTQMAVHAYDEKTAIVSMNYWQDATVGGIKSSGDYFVVDVWRNTDSGWKLAVRYVSPLERKAARHDSTPPRKY